MSPRKAPGPGHNKVYRSFVRETASWHRDERDMALYLLVCPQRATEGLFELSTREAAFGIDWDQTRVANAWISLAKRGWLAVDSPWVFIRKALRWTQPSTPDHIKGAVNRVAGAPRDSFVWVEYLAAAEQWAPKLFEALLAADALESHGSDTPVSPDALRTGAIRGVDDGEGSGTPVPLESSTSAQAYARTHEGAREATGGALVVFPGTQVGVA